MLPWLSLAVKRDRPSIPESDDFYQTFEGHWLSQPLLTSTCGERLCRSRLSLSEVMTIAVSALRSRGVSLAAPLASAFHGSRRAHL